jgi:murein DD-endopeptidase MepM/ murein hydrolase activator NlpD
MVLGILVFVAGAHAPVAGAQVAPAKPAFASPFTCGQTWFARTYAGHPQYAVDWNLPGSGEADFGQPVLAGAPGVVTVGNNAGYGNMVTIDHGNGWTTLYAHLWSIAVSTGERVVRNRVIGQVGRTGWADGSHLHQEQSFNGVRQPIEVDGHPVLASFSSRGQSYVSANCVTTVVTTAAWPFRTRGAFASRRPDAPITPTAHVTKDLFSVRPAV